MFTTEIGTMRHMGLLRAPMPTAADLAGENLSIVGAKNGIFTFSDSPAQYSKRPNRWLATYPQISKRKSFCEQRTYGSRHYEEYFSCIYVRHNHDCCLHGILLER